MKPLISFCSQCKGRRAHLKLTLLHNLKCIAKYNHLDYVLLDFDSNDNLLEWIQNSQFDNYLNLGLLKYYKVENQPYYLQSAVKNLSHRLSTGSNVINVDADNVLSDIYVETVVDAFTVSTNTVVSAKTVRASLYGAFGRIGMPRIVFDYIHGYDEVYEYWGDEDHDILDRIRNLGNKFSLKHIQIECDKLGKVIDHSNALRFENYPAEVFQEDKKYALFNTNRSLSIAEQNQVFKEANHKHGKETREKKLIFSRKFGKKFDVMQLINGKLVDIGNI